MDLAGIRALLHRGRYLRALNQAVQLASQPHLPPVQRVDALVLAHQAAAQRGMVGEAAAHAQAALSLAKEVGYTAGATRARLCLAIAANQARECAEAEKLLYEVLAQQATLDPHLLGVAQYELARTYEAQREYQTAAQWYRKAASTFHECGRLREAAMAHRNAAWLALRQGKWAVAEADLASAALLTTQDDHELAAAQLTLEALLQYELGNRSEAVDLAEELLTPGHPGATAWVRTCAAYVVAAVSHEEGRPDLAAAFLRKALASAAECQDTALMNLVTALKGRIGIEG